MRDLNLRDFNLGEFKVRVFFIGNKDEDKWQSSCIEIDRTEIRMGDREFISYGNGTTIESCLAETGRQLDGLIKQWYERREAEKDEK